MVIFKNSSAWPSGGLNKHVLRQKWLKYETVQMSTTCVTHWLNLMQTHNHNLPQPQERDTPHNPPHLIVGEVTLYALQLPLFRSTTNVRVQILYQSNHQWSSCLFVNLRAQSIYVAEVQFLLPAWLFKARKLYHYLTITVYLWPTF